MQVGAVSTYLDGILKRLKRKTRRKLNGVLHVSLRWDVGNGGPENFPGEGGGCVDGFSWKYSHAHPSTTCRGRSARLHSQTNERFHVVYGDAFNRNTAPVSLVLFLSYTQNYEGGKRQKTVILQVCVTKSLLLFFFRFHHDSKLLGCSPEDPDVPPLHRGSKIC